MVIAASGKYIREARVARHGTALMSSMSASNQGHRKELLCPSIGDNATGGHRIILNYPAAGTAHSHVQLTSKRANQNVLVGTIRADAYRPNAGINGRPCLDRVIATASIRACTKRGNVNRTRPFHAKGCPFPQNDATIGATSHHVIAYTVHAGNGAFVSGNDLSAASVTH